MEHEAIIAAGVSILSSIIVGLIAWGVRNEMSTLRAEFRAAIAEAGNTFYELVNGKYVRKELHNEMTARIDRIENRVEDLE